MSWYLMVLKKYAVFNGRARRKEYWMFFLFNFIVALVLGLIEWIIGMVVDSSTNVLSGIYGLAVLVPSLAVSVRRLHDTSRSGFWLFISLVPLIGSIVLLIFMIIDGQHGENKYGPNPKESSA
jgi:uncharacterized membrane protein YhaH (DUF805 family)